MKISLSRVQTIVGLTAAAISIAGAVVTFFKPAPDKGKLVAIVQDAKTEKAVSDATIEVLTPTDAIVTTLKPNWSGEAHCNLDEGQYRLRVSHPRYLSETREVRLIASHDTEVHVQLRAGSLGNTVRRVFHH
jgi:hypothetical protein